MAFILSWGVYIEGRVKSKYHMSNNNMLLITVVVYVTNAEQSRVVVTCATMMTCHHTSNVTHYKINESVVCFVYF